MGMKIAGFSHDSSNGHVTLTLTKDEDAETSVMAQFVMPPGTEMPTSEIARLLFQEAAISLAYDQSP
jgi:hypothetical protein